MFDEMFFVGFLSRIKQYDRDRAERNSEEKKKERKKKGEKSAKKECRCSAASLFFSLKVVVVITFGQFSSNSFNNI